MHANTRINNKGDIQEETLVVVVHLNFYCKIYNINIRKLDVMIIVLWIR